MILLHHCCVVCTPKALEFLRNEFENVTGFWYNPNIMPEEEKSMRLNALRTYSGIKNHHLIIEDDYLQQHQWLEEAQEIEESGQDRCEFCYYVRLRRTSSVAKIKGFDYFTTTLLSSHHQKHELVKKSGERAGRESGVRFYYRDFRPFFYEGKNEVYKQGLYMQKYCGCVFSLTNKCLHKSAKF